MQTTHEPLEIGQPVSPTPAPRPLKGTPGRASWMALAALISPALVLYVLFVIYPIVQSLRFSVYRWNGLGPLVDFVGLDNFVEAFNSPDFRAAVLHCAIIAVLSLTLQLPFALALAVILNQKLAGRGLFRTMFFAPYVLSEVVTGVVWRQLLRPDGMVDRVLETVGPLMPGVSSESVQEFIRPWLGDPGVALYSLFFVLTWKYFGLHMILLLAGLQGIPDELKEAAAIDGAGRWQSFRYVTLPLLGPTVRISIFLMVIGSFHVFDLVWVTTKGGPIGATQTMATYLIDFGFGRGRFGYGGAVSILIFAISMVLALLYQRFVLRRDVEGALT
ncbi:MAG TPA: sugar ABC transporter permease [Acidimicrobiia bacterium]|jgi:raffinose/stachyose/melibiose transport system permease protein|nr:sugar ABC transporter permease [Acidimicrobiia bacterium]